MSASEVPDSDEENPYDDPELGDGLLIAEILANKAGGEAEKRLYIPVPGLMGNETTQAQSCLGLMARRTGTAREWTTLFTRQWKRQVCTSNPSVRYQLLLGRLSGIGTRPLGWEAGVYVFGWVKSAYRISLLGVQLALLLVSMF
jgi:hypothetical protein